MNSCVHLRVSFLLLVLGSEICRDILIGDFLHEKNSVYSFTLLTAINLAFLYCPAVAVFALIKDETAAAVGAQGKDAVSGNLFLWLLCAIAFLKVVTKLDGILHSLGIGVSRSPGSMLSKVLLAFRGFEIG